MHRTETTEHLNIRLVTTPDSWDSTLPERLWFAGEQPTDQGLILVSRNGQETIYTWTEILERSRKTATLLQEKVFSSVIELPLYCQRALIFLMSSLDYKSSELFQYHSILRCDLES